MRLQAGGSVRPGRPAVCGGRRGGEAHLPGVPEHGRRREKEGNAQAAGSRRADGRAPGLGKDRDDIAALATGYKQF